MQSGGPRIPSPGICEEESGTSSELGPGRQGAEMNQSQPLETRDRTCWLLVPRSERSQSLDQQGEAQPQHAVHTG